MSIRRETKQAAQVFPRVLLIAVTLCLFFATARAQDDTALVYGKSDSVTIAIDKVMQEMFWRVRANDNSVFYENEFPHLRESMGLDKYLGGVRFVQSREPNSDSIIAITVDSASVVADTALAYLTLGIRCFGSDTTYNKHRVQRLYRVNGMWIRPLSTTPKSYIEYNRRIQRYEEDAGEEAEN